MEVLGGTDDSDGHVQGSCGLALIVLKCSASMWILLPASCCVCVSLGLCSFISSQATKAQRPLPFTIQVSLWHQSLGESRPTGAEEQPPSSASLQLCRAHRARTTAQLHGFSSAARVPKSSLSSRLWSHPSALISQLLSDVRFQAAFSVLGGWD